MSTFLEILEQLSEAKSNVKNAIIKFFDSSLTRMNMPTSENLVCWKTMVLRWTIDW
jgi:hypothetical protein